MTSLVAAFRARTSALLARAWVSEEAARGCGAKCLGLWGEIRPHYVVVENSPALAFRGLERVLCDLSAIGYDAEWQCVPNCAFGFPHRRERIYIVAYPHEVGLQGCFPEHGLSAPVLRGWPPEEDYGRTLAEGVLSLGECRHYRGGDGVPGWSHRVGALGNAVNPVVARWLFECIRRFDSRLPSAIV